MSKQDRQGVRTASDLERKYNLGLLTQGYGGNNSEQISKVAQELSEYKTKSNNKFREIQVEIDLVTALANANKAAHEANAAAIKTTQEEVNKLSGRVTTLEGQSGVYTEATSQDINGLFEQGDGTWL